MTSIYPKEIENRDSGDNEMGYHTFNARHLLVILIFILFVFPGSWHFDIHAARFSDELLQEHDGLPRVLAVEVPLLIQVTGGLYDDWVYF